MPDYLDNYKYDNLSEDMQTVSSIIGIEATKKLMRAFKGCHIYFPCRVNKKYMQKYIVENYNGENKQLILRHLGIKEWTFYSVLRSKINCSTSA